MTRLQLLRAQALLVELSVVERHLRRRGSEEAAGAVALDREHVRLALGSPVRVDTLRPDGTVDPRLEALLDRLEVETWSV